MLQHSIGRIVVLINSVVLVINMLYKQVFFLLEFSCMGLGARLVVESQGGGGGAS